MAWKTWTVAAILLQALPFIAASPQDPSSVSKPETFEYVVIGSGPGGGPLAANLARAGHKTLLLEAGDDEEGNLNEAIPAFGGVATGDPTMAWNFFVKHYEDNAQALKDPKMVWNMTNGTWYVGLNPPPGSTQLGIWYPRAGTLGGCDTHNAGITVYPNRDDWQTIVDLTGDDSWDPDTMRNYMKRIERNLYLPKGTPGHGFSGYIATNVLNKTVANQDPQLIAMAKGADIAYNHSSRTSSNDFGKLATLDLNNNDANRDQQQDLFQIPVHMNETVGRSHVGLYVTATANAVFANGTKKYPLTVRLNSLATKVIFDSTKRATGVQYLQGKSLYRADARSAGTKGVSMTVSASKEVILSGGVFNTPQLLKLSGVGPKAELTKFKIPVIADLPGVGNSLQDHYEIAVISQAPAAYAFLANCTFGFTPDDPCLAQWRAGTGPYASSAFPEMITKLSSVATDGVRDIFGFGGPLYFTGFQPINPTGPVGSYTWGMVKSRAKNKAGTVLLKSADPQDTPLINFNYFKQGGDEDLQGLADAVAWARKVFASVPAPGAPQVEVYPGSNVSTPDQIKTYIKNEAYSHHGCCTAGIGADSDPNAVLDSAFRVRGVKGLRVVDGSAFPQAPGSFPMLATLVLSEKAADAILADA